MNDNKKAIDRRSFLLTATAAGVGAVALGGAARAGEPAAAPAVAQGTAAPASQGAAAPATPKPTGSRKLDDVLKVAREKLYPRCRVCPECDGQACAGEVPGMGGIGSGMSFKNNVTALQRVRLNLRSLHDGAKPDLSTTVFGQKLDVPFMITSLAGTTYNMGGKISEEDFIEALFGGAAKLGTMSFVADGTEDPLAVYQTRLKAITRYGRGIGVIKPRDQQELLRRLRLVEEAGATAVAVDVDSAGRAARAAKLGEVIEPKTARHLEEIARATKLPFIVKGVMTPDEALVAVQCGAKGIVVSNHGGRCLDHTPGTAEVLPAIAAKVKGKASILVDGGARHGGDVLKFLALGADVVLVGRPCIRGAFGGGAEGVQLVLEKIRGELAQDMILTGTRSARKVDRKIVTVA
jgi:isopentenyl diphosphate isomerase/L-lactate dehydrogenase-like FMN-dependent dehydrogenase